MANRYFDKFPTVNYNGFNIVNLTTSAKLIDKYVNVPYVYTQIDLDKEQRADIIANDQYNDPYLTWLIYYANKIIDPYYGWYLSEYDFGEYINQKYGSIDVAQRKIMAFVTNWFDDNQELSPSAFNARFGEFKGFHSNYWNPLYDEESGTLLYYIRKRQNLEVITNKHIRVEVQDSTGFNFGDLITIKDFQNGDEVGEAEIEDIIGNLITLKNILNNIDNNYYLFNDAGINTQIIDYSEVEDFTSNVWTSKAISNEEFVYWTSLSAYDLERELNNYKKTVKIVDGLLAPIIANQLQVDLNAK